MLIINNNPTHPPAETLNKIYDEFEAIFLPVNVTALLQRMDEEVTEKLKRIYKKQIFEYLLLSDKNAESALVFSQAHLKRQ